MEHFDGRKGFQLISMEEGILFTRIDRIPFAKFVWSSVCRYSYEYSQYEKKNVTQMLVLQKRLNIKARELEVEL